jgi:hypothetical protein
MSEASLIPLEKAIARLQEAFAAYEAQPEQTMYRDAVIKRLQA